jgi:hypothetical protein
VAQKVQILLVDDLDGGEATETVKFSLDGTSYEIDLSDGNATALRDALAVYIAEARKVGSGRRSSGGGNTGKQQRSSTGGPAASEIREWARANGMEVPERGRVSAEVRKAYDLAH